jgi:hypothetical protein
MAAGLMRVLMKAAEWGTMRSTLPPSVLPDISPARGEIGCRHWFRQSPRLQSRRRQSGRPISPLVGEMSGPFDKLRTEGGATGGISEPGFMRGIHG